MNALHTAKNIVTCDLIPLAVLEHLILLLMYGEILCHM